MRLEKPEPSAEAPRRVGGSAGTPAERARMVRRALWVTLGLNLGAAAVKLAGGLASGSLALSAAGIDSAFDGLSNLAGVAAMHVAGRPPDEDHPYGHRKFETLVAVVIALLLLVTCGRLVLQALGRLGALLWPGSPLFGDFVVEAAPRIGPLVLAAPLVALALNLMAASYEARRGRALRSELLLADAGHTRADAAVSLAVLLGLLAMRAGWAWVDPLLALGIAGVIAWVGIGIARETTAVLADAAVLEPADVAAAAREVKGVADVHKVRSRGSADAVALDLHVQVDPRLGIGPAHAIGHEVADHLSRRFPEAVDVVVHVEPDWSAVGGELTGVVRLVLARFHVDAHEIRILVDEDGGAELALHLELDPGMRLAEAHETADRVEAALRAAAPELRRVVTHLEPRVAAPLPGRRAAGRDWAALARRETEALPGLRDAHDAEARALAGGVHLSVHVLADGALPLVEAHALAERLEQRLRGAAPELAAVTVHVEPDDHG